MNLRNKVIKNASWIIACRVAQALMSLVIGMITARYLGPSSYGIISYASSLVTFFVPVIQLGFRNTLVQELIAHPEKEGQILGTAILSCIIMSFFGIMGIISFTLIANKGEPETIIVCALYSISLIFQMSEMIQYWFQAKLLSKYISITSLAVYAVILAYKIYLLVTAKSIYWFAVTNAFDFLLISIVLLIVYYKLRNQKLAYSFHLFQEMFSRSKHYIVSGMMITIFSQTDRIMLNLMIGEAETGYYAAAATCAGMTSFVFAALIDSFRPVILENKLSNQVAFEKNTARLYSIIIYLALAQSVVMCIFSNLIVGILYGEAYAASASILSILVWYSTFSYMGSVRNIWILAEEKQHILWIVNLSGAILNVVGNFILIPKLGGDGAAIASVGTQLFTNFGLCFILKPLRPTVKIIVNSLNPKTFIELINMIRNRKGE